MALLPLLDFFRRILQHLSVQNLVQLCHRIANFLRSLRARVFSRRAHNTSPIPSFNEPARQHEGASYLNSGQREQEILLSSASVQDQVLELAVITESPRSSSSSGNFSVQVVPPSISSNSTGSHVPQHTQSVIQGEGSENNLTRQIYLVQRETANNSRVSVVLPAAPTLQHEVRLADIPPPGPLRSSDEVSRAIYPIMPSQVKRYKRDRIIDPKTATFVLPPAQETFSLGELPDGWIQLTHPEGQPYFYHQEKRIITEAWLWDSDERTEIEKFIKDFEEFTRTRNLYRPENTDLVLEYTKVDGVSWCGYYYISHSSRILFWLEKFDISRFLKEVRGELPPTHIKTYLEFEYWYHWDLFPNVNKLSTDVLHHVADVIEAARTDVLTSTQSTVNHTPEALKEMADIIEGATRKAAYIKSSGWCIGRFMQMIARDQFLNFHGQYGARLNRSQTIHGNSQIQGTWLIKISNILLFASPNVHLKTMESLWVDRLTIKAQWVQFFSKLNRQWSEHILHAEVLLTVNVAFLAIPSNDPSNNTDTVLPIRTATQIASYLSIAASFGCVVIALLLVRQYKTRERGNVEELRYFLRKKYNTTHSLETLAIMYSLPYSLLIWGMTTFFFAYLCMCFDHSSLVARVIVGLATLAVCLLIGWCIMMGWETIDYDWWLSKLPTFLTGSWGRAEGDGDTSRPSRLRLGEIWNRCVKFRPTFWASRREAQGQPSGPNP